jgi:hypothetical protein
MKPQIAISVAAGKTIHDTNIDTFEWPNLRRPLL